MAAGLWLFWRSHVDLGDNWSVTLEIDAKHARLISAFAAATQSGDLNALTQPALAYLRLHGRDAQAYLRGKTVAERFYYDYSDNEIDQIAPVVGRVLPRGIHREPVSAPVAAFSRWGATAGVHDGTV